MKTRTTKRSRGFILLAELLYIAALVVVPVVIGVLCTEQSIDPNSPIPTGTTKL